MGRTIIISNRLPITVSKKDDKFIFKSSEGGLATGLGSVNHDEGMLWIGWPGISVEKESEVSEITTTLSQDNLVPVFLSSVEIKEYYEGFSNEVLWPIFHYYASTHANYKQSNWDYYKEVNKKFSEVVAKYVEPDDVIWVHDYQLLLLPELIRAIHPNISIGFFLHIPFPSVEIFRLLPWRSELLSGMLGADLLGFHTFNDVRHFLETVTQFLPVASSANTIALEDRVVVAEPFPMGIDSEKYNSLPEKKKVKKHIDELKRVSQDRKTILCIDRLDYSKGIPQRLQAFEKLLVKHPEYKGKIVLHMIVVPSRDKVPEYKELKKLIDRRVGEINSRYRTIDWNPVNYFYRSFPIEELSALYAHSEVCMVTPMRDGMNLVSKEYIASRIDGTGVLILSEMAGASKELVDAIIVNPSNVDSVTEAIITALEMPEEEQRRRMKLMRAIVSKFSVSHWVKIFMERLKEIKHMQESMQTRKIGPTTAQAIKRLYHESQRRIIFLDYDGTLVNFSADINSVSPDKDLYDLLNVLISDPLNFVVLISGRSHQNLEEWFGHMEINLIAEHGAWHRRAGVWEEHPGLDDQWKKDIYPVLDMFVDRTPGAFIEEKDFSLVWHYRKVEKGLGELRTSELVNNIKYLINDRGLQVLSGNKVVEIKNIEINKGKASLGHLHNKDYDFIMAIGDDHTDEDIFKSIPDDAVTIKVGSNISSARFYLRDPGSVRRLLRSLSEPVVTDDH
ncbi:MAG: bifunctional alpha,alpha-trehalose-phosphate synthase (UDP-forming)/trehalose-phosphatase [Daejeonella sp.]|uniref:bifunctional alpha,alpha-trehalose-phosphate synthase (UDP-forming)/trehalose-phosphatase n=1 Tax=Daejeonella sp. TaxID=2805397 RepID=UPI003C76B325